MKTIFKTTTAILALGLAILLVFIGAKTWPWGENKEAANTATEITPTTEEPEAEQPEAEEAAPQDGGGDLAAALGFNTHEPTEEEKELIAASESEGKFLVLSQISPEEAEAEATDFALGEVSQTMLDQVMDGVSREPDFSSLCTNLEGDEVARARKRAAKERGLVGYEISDALGFPFESDMTDEEALWAEVKDHTRNMVWLAAQYRLDGRCQVLDTTYRKIVGNEHFDKFVLEWAKAYSKDEESFRDLLKHEKGYEELADADYESIPGKGGDGYQHWLVYLGKDDNGKEIYELTDSARTYGAMYILWLGCKGHNHDKDTKGAIGYSGIKNWPTVEKSYLQDDFVANPVMAYAFFTEDPNMQTDLPSLVFCPYDKNGKRIGEYFGINYVTTDAERYLQEGKAKVEDRTITVKGGSDSNVKVVALNKTNKVETKTPASKPTATPTATPTTTPKKEYDKKKEASSVLKPENQIDGKDPVGQGTDAFQQTKPAEAASTVEQAQHQSTEQTQDIINNGGQKTTPGQEGPTEQPADTVARQTESNVVAYDETRPEDPTDNNNEWTESKTVTTPEIPVQTDADGDGTNNSESSTVTNFFNQ